MANLNKVILVGHLVRDPEKRMGPSGNPFGLFTIACNYRYKDKNSKPQEEVAFVPCLVFGPAIEWLSDKKRGTLTIVCGRLRTESWDDSGTQMSQLVLVCESVQFAEKSSRSGTTAVATNAGKGDGAADNNIPF